jgi:ABC-type phosphate transport system substrate-binding protein
MKLLSSLLVFLLAPHQADAQQCYEAYQKAAGAVTVYPYATQLAVDYKANCSQYSLSVEAGGSSVGVKRVCGDPALGPVEIGLLSRDFKSTEAAKQSDGYSFNCLIGDPTRQVARLAVANDAVIVFVKADPITQPALALFEQKSSLSTAECIKKLGCLSKDILRWIYSNYTVSQLLSNGWHNVIPNSDNNDTTHLWSELDSACSGDEIKISGTDYAAGDFDLFKSSILTGPFEGVRSEYVPFTNKSQVNEYVINNDGAIGFNDYNTAFSTIPNATVAVPIQNSAWVCIGPSSTTIADGTYNPFSRKTYMSVLKNNCTGLKAALGYIQFAVSPIGQDIIKDNGGVKLNFDQQNDTSTKIAALSTCI